jgi:DNA polymerase
MREEAIQQLKLYLEFLQEMGVEFLPRSHKIKSVHCPSTSEGPSQASQISTLEQVREEMGDCKRCPLWKSRHHLVFGEGNPHSRLMFVGEAPGREEDLQGRPFVGQAGKLLDQFLQAAGMSRNDVYIANILKCRPPGNRTPAPEEVKQCLPFLMKQIQAISPSIICCLGAVAAQTLLGQKTPITRLKGQFMPWKWSIELFPTFHPAYLLRNPGQKKGAMQDFLKLKERLEDSA